MPVHQERDFEGLWGRPTATIDWCEANYEVTRYIAEFWNTISNIVMVLLPLIGAIFAVKDKLEARFIGSYIALFFVGVGSWLFHGTLLYESQLLDELPMIWGTSFLVYGIKEVSGKPGDQNSPFIIFLFVYCSLVTVIYVTINEPVFHEAAYGLMVFTLIYYSIKIVRNHHHSTVLFWLSLSIYGLGFLVWNLDNIFCDKVRGLRDDIGYPLKPLLQGHAWWHILAGTGTYLSILFSIHARSNYLKRNTQIQMPLGIIPLIRVDSK